MIAKIFLALAAVLAGFLVFVAFQPSHFHISRTATLAAPPDAVFAQVNDLRKSHAWNPWVKLDPAAKFTFDGPATGVGASSAWLGNRQIGEGRQTITESRAPEFVRVRLDFKQPFESTCHAEFAVKPAGTGSSVTWSMTGENNYIARIFCTLMSQDKMIGEPFEQGLAGLKAIVEAPPKS